MVDVITVPAEETPASAQEGHDERMAAAFDAAQAGARQDVQQDAPPADPHPDPRPGWLPEKFKAPEDLAKAYAELERRLSSGTRDEPDRETAEAPSKEQAQRQVEAAGLDYQALASEFAEAGDLSPDSYDRLAQAGIPREMVDAYIRGQYALAESMRNGVLEQAGGADTYAAMVEWARVNMSPGQIDAYNRAVDSGDLDTVSMAVQGLMARYTAANGAEPTLLNGGTEAGQGVTFRSTAELTTAMRDPRYATDPAYRADVEARLARSSIF